MTSTSCCTQVYKVSRESQDAESTALHTLCSRNEMFAVSGSGPNLNRKKRDIDIFLFVGATSTDAIKAVMCAAYLVQDFGNSSHAPRTTLESLQMANQHVDNFIEQLRHHEWDTQFLQFEYTHGQLDLLHASTSTTAQP